MLTSWDVITAISLNETRVWENTVISLDFRCYAFLKRAQIKHLNIIDFNVIIYTNKINIMLNEGELKLL